MSRFSDDNLDFLTMDRGICNKCKHKDMRDMACDAYPDGIPEEILRGMIDHTKPYDGDNDIQFEPLIEEE